MSYGRLVGIMRGDASRMAYDLWIVHGVSAAGYAHDKVVVGSGRANVQRAPSFVG